MLGAGLAWRAHARSQPACHRCPGARLSPVLGVQVVSMFLPKRINVRRKAAWYAAQGEPDDMSPKDAQVPPSRMPCHSRRQARQCSPGA